MAGEKVGVDVMKLSLPQLTQLKQQLDNEIDLLGSSIQQLKVAQSKFQESGECVDKLSEEKQPKSVLIPLTESMYIPGELEDVSKVLLDVGTGYFLEKEIPAAKDYFSRKTKFVTTQIEKLQGVAKEKVFLRGVVIEAVESKIQAALSAQQVAAAGSAKS